MFSASVLVAMRDVALADIRHAGSPGNSRKVQQYWLQLRTAIGEDPILLEKCTKELNAPEGSSQALLTAIRCYADHYKIDLPQPYQRS